MVDSSFRRKKLRILGLTIAFGLAVVGCCSGYWSYVMSGTATPLRWWSNWLQDVGTEMLGAAVTILLVELVIYQKRDEASRVDQERMRRQDYFTQQLKQAHHPNRRQKILNRMRQQNLFENAWLYGINLQNMDLCQGNFSGADLFEADLRNSNLAEANLTDAILRKACIQGCSLRGAVLQGTDLTEANLAQADLYEATLEDVDLSQTIFDEKTRLPDGTYWESEYDLTLITPNLEPKAL